MSKPEFSKPFNLEHAKAGAPFAGEHGEAVRVLIWDRKHPTHPIIAIKVDGDQEAVAFRIDGTTDYGHPAVVQRLVMLPLGFIDGKPIFVGDELVYISSGRTTFVEPDDKNFSHCRWPALTPAYPVTLMTDGDLVSNYYGGGPVSHEQEYQAWRRIANAAIRHGIDNRYLLDPTTAAKNIHNAVSTFASEVERRHAIVHIERERKMIRAGIEQGWREAYLTFSEPPPPHVERRVPSAMPRSDTDVDELIASVTGDKDTKDGAK